MSRGYREPVQGEFGREEHRGIWGAIAGIVGALSSIGAGVYGATQAGGSSGGRIQTQRVPLPPKQQAFQDYMLRVAAANVNKQPLTFADWVDSGGTAKLQLDNAMMTPEEARKLGFTDRFGGAVPYFDPKTQSALDTEQLLFSGRELARRGINHPLAKVYRASHRADRLEQQLASTPSDAKNRQRLENKSATARQRYLNLLRRVEGL